MSSQYYISINQSGWEITAERPILSSSSKVLINGENELTLIQNRSEKTGNVTEVQYSNEGWRVTDTIRSMDDGLFIVERTWENLTGSSQEVVLLFEAKTTFKPSFYMIPCVSYNGNRWGTGREPKGLMQDGKPWVFPYDRTGLPSATFSEDTNYSVGLFASDRDERSLCSSCSMTETEGGMIHRLIWPEREEPVSYSGKDTYSSPMLKTITLQGNETYRSVFYIVISEVKIPNTGWFKAYDIASDLFDKELPMAYSPEKVWKLGISYAEGVLLHEWKGSSVFEMGLLPEGSHAVRASRNHKWKYRENSVRHEIGWCGQNGTLALALIEEGIRSGKSETINKGISVLDAWEQYARIGNGLFYILFEHAAEKKSEATMDTCNLAWGAWQMMNAYETAGKAGISKPRWLDMGLELCDFFIRNQAPGGGFGKLWNSDGVCVDAGGTIGAFILIPLLKAFELTGKKEYLHLACDAFKFYTERDLDKMECTAGALDTHCVDKETCWPLLKTAIDIYEITNEKYYLDKALAAAYYTLSWMFHYDVLYDGNSEFEKYGYRTYGGTAVSTQYQQLDPWGALLCSDWLRIYRHTGDERWLKRARATWANSLLCLSDGNLIIRGMQRPAGSQNECFYQCNCISGKVADNRGGVNDWLVAWPGAFRLLTLIREKDWGLLTD